MIVARDLFLFVYVALLVVENEPVQNHMSKPVNNLNFRHMPTTTINSRNRHFHCKQALPQRHPPTLACTQSCTNNISTIHCTAAKLRARKNCKHKSKRTHLSHRAPITTRVHGTNLLGGPWSHSGHSSACLLSSSSCFAHQGRCDGHTA